MEHKNLLYLVYIANPNKLLISQASLRGATLVATKQSRKVIRNGLPRPLRGSRNDASLLWLNASRVSYIVATRKNSKVPYE
ncbi:hypothetical protein [Candidatus Tisiphia endosymbiont of Hybos culiciformis]|uniref:hypothetical protein n=1 Tax=Candidatus Tisiphia endosymbiont of Hybos culiciformis TaxID=3139331 RepID=UPI003CCB3028